MSKSRQSDSMTSLAEFIGTAYFLFMGLGGSDAISQLSTNPSTVETLSTAFAFGWSLMINVWLWADISYGIFNPAITIALMVTGKLGGLRGTLYIIAQFAGAVVGSFLIKIFQPAPFISLTTLTNETSIIQGLVMEIMTTSLLTLAVLMLAIEKKGHFMAPFGIGTSLFVSVLVAGPYTGASLNPARTFGTAFVTGIYSDIWIYFVGPILGSLLAAMYYFMFKRYYTPELDVPNP